jgi:acyl carrier protein
VNRAALPAPETPAEPVQPQAATEEEHAVHALWREVLGAPGAAATDSFWELGGHSLLAMRLTSRVREAFGVELPVSALFEAPTAREFATRVAEARARRGELQTRLDWLESLSEEEALALLAAAEADRE